MSPTNLVKTGIAVCVASLLYATGAQAQTPRFDPSPLVKLGDKMRYGSTYSIIKIGDGVYDINDRDTYQRDSTAPQGSDLYLIVGSRSALLIDLGNDYVTGVASQSLKARPGVGEEFRTMISGLAHGLPVDVALSHDHVDHTGMTGALVKGTTVYPNFALWVSELETLEGLKPQHGIDPPVYKRFKSGEKVFDLGGGRIVNTFYTRGHTPGSTTYIVKDQGVVFTGDAWGVGFGLGIRSVDALKVFASDSKTVVDYIKGNFSPYERYALKVFPAHSRYAGTTPYRSNKIPYYDAAYFDWRWLQEMSLAANGVLKGLWLEKGAGMRLEIPESTNPAAAPDPEQRYVFVYGTGSVTMPLSWAYEAAGLKMPADGKPPQ